MTEPRPEVLADDSAGLAAAVATLREGGIVAFPTDTVYGIAVSLGTPGGIERLFHVKHRPWEKGIALLLADAEQAETVGVMDGRARLLAGAFWPGPLTIVLRARPDAELPEALTGGTPTIGVRVPDHPTPRALARALGPLPTTSANPSGEPDALEAADVIARLGADVWLVLDGGRTPGAVPSTVVDLSVEPPQVRRVGVLDREQVLAVLRDADPPDSGPDP